MSPRVTVQAEDFNLEHEVSRLRAGDAGVGAVVTFVGTVRDRNTSAAAGEVSLLELDHYPGMTARAIESMIDAALLRFPAVRGVRVIHRIGVLKPCDQIVLVAVTSAHRGESFSACEFLMDYLKTQAPFWKKEHRPDGTSVWVDARVADDAALQRWGLQGNNAAALPHA